MLFSARRRLLYLYLREGWRRFARRLSLARLAALRFSGSTPDRLIVAPTDLRAIDPFVAEEILQGRYPLAGRVLDTEGESPFEIDLPSHEFANRLHAFDWLRHMRAVRDEAGFTRLRQIVDDWMGTHGRNTGGISWEADVTAQRVIAWLSHSPVVLRNAEHGFYRRFLRSLAYQVRYLRHIAGTVPEGEARLRVRIALAMASVSMPVSSSVLRRAARALDLELDRQILPDGGHFSRNPRAGLELLLDLLPLRQTYVNLGHDVPSRLISGIDRMYPALRFFRHQSGELALFNGATSVPAHELASVLRYDETAGEPFRSLPHISFERLSLGETVVIVDTGRPLSAHLSRSAHAGCLSFEMSSGRNRLIVNSGAPKFAGERFRQMARATAAHSTVTVNDTSSSRFSQSRFLGPIMVSGVSQVEAERSDEPGRIESVKASHDGYLAAFGLIHERDVGILNGGRLIRGRDRLSQENGSDPEASDSAIAVARFHIHPAIGLRQSSKSEIYLSAPDGEAWLFACRDGDLAIEEDVFFADPSGVRASSQITVTFAVAAQPEIQWTLTSEG
ncbi:heparinase II/III family protein [Sinorhizobium americanum]|uniref:Heparinase II/III-like protein n=1 Tax=Sinorhizobium americanum TaxID=194963 RepID=A0A1L3LSA2_9HYPH|nr:heparinase II/III family protein [Sinorhizobium americanum]APG86320.1 heparinase II/III-like protein [Sinorhizobium americanum CCGM7]APG92957.1 heparinase II/III-like protein [Sinorhizobium americanum]OAP49218.1 heparinase [Sinorhizobium americanum]TCN31787.1 putative heparinase superfamily protein [Sinorhizobium americanum]